MAPARAAERAERDRDHELDLGLALQPDAARHTLPHFLEDVAARHGPRDALCFAGDVCSYADLLARSRSLAKGLVALGVDKGSRVGLLIANRPEWVEAAFAVAQAGGIAVPVSTFATPDERDYILRHGDVSWLLLQTRLGRRDFGAELLARYPALSKSSLAAAGFIRELPYLRGVFPLAGERCGAGSHDFDSIRRLGEAIDDGLLDARIAEVTPGDAALVIYTSGTTDVPKGILHAQRAPVIQSWRFAEFLGLAPHDRVFTAQPFFWTAGICMSLGASLGAGACLWLEESFDAANTLACIERERITTLHAWPHQEKALAEHPAAAGSDLSSLRHVEFTSPLAALIPLERDVWGTYACYGLSETFTLASALPAWAPAELRQRTHGRPLPGMRVRIVDPATGTPLAAGEKGEIAVKGATFMLGYTKLPLEQAVDAEGFFRTGDAGSLDADGYLHWSGRLSNLIKTGGANVSPLEIEHAALEYPGITAAAALGIPHPTLGEAVVLCAVLSEGSELAPEPILAALRERLSAYKLPRAVLFFRDEEVEYTGNQKIQLEPMHAAAMQRLRDAGIEIAGHRYGSEESAR